MRKKNGKKKTGKRKIGKTKKYRFAGASCTFFVFLLNPFSINSFLLASRVQIYNQPHYEQMATG
jgi:hypothetical protein